jgi:hypothetical protein
MSGATTPLLPHAGMAWTGTALLFLEIINFCYDLIVIKRLIQVVLLFIWRKLSCSNRPRLELIVYCRVYNIVMYKAIYLLTQFFNFRGSEICLTCRPMTKHIWQAYSYILLPSDPTRYFIQLKILKNIAI